MVFVPATYYGYIDYVIQNSVILLNIDEAPLELKQAAIQIFNGHPIMHLDTNMLLSMAFLGCVIIYVSILVLINKASVLRSLFTKAYWKKFTLLP